MFSESVKISGVSERVQRPLTPNHRPTIGGRAAMADDKTAKEKKSEQGRAWKQSHRDAVLASKKASYNRHKTRILAAMAATYAANREVRRAKLRAAYAAKRNEKRAQSRERYASDPEYRAALLARCRAYRAARLDLIRERDKVYSKSYRDRDPGRAEEISRRGNQRRRALSRDAFVEPIDALVVFSRDKGKCGICHLPVDPKSKWHIDHVVPLSKGGVHSYANVQLAHARCNLSKNGRFQTGQIGLFQKLLILGAPRA